MTLAAPPRKPPTKKVAAITRSTSIPTRAAAVGSCETARIAFPSRVVFTSTERAIISGTTTTITSRSLAVNCNPSPASRFVAGSSSGNERSAGPSQNRPTFMKMNDTPIAETSGASFGALRSGR